MEIEKFVKEFTDGLSLREKEREEISCLMLGYIAEIERKDAEIVELRQQLEDAEKPDWVKAGDNTLHGAIDHWQERALKAEAKVAELKAQPEAGDAVARMTKTIGDVFMQITVQGNRLPAGEYDLYTHPAPVVPEGLLNLLNAVGHVGVDFGYGPYELCAEEIEKARDLYAQLSAAQEQG